jgi:hypothetical protein
MLEENASFTQNEYEVRKLLESVLGLVKDDSALVSLAAKNVLLKIRGLLDNPAAVV